MNRLAHVLIAALIALAGCAKKEEAPAAGAAAEPAIQAVEPAAPAEQPALVQQLAGEVDKGVAAVREALPAAVDWSSLTWDKVATIPYENKDQLVAWAGSQVDAMRDQLTQAAVSKGTTGLLSGMTGGDTGWQGALTGVVSALDQVRQASPETWDLARGALIGAWGKLQTAAAKVLGGG